MQIATTSPRARPGQTGIDLPDLPPCPIGTFPNPCRSAG